MHIVPLVLPRWALCPPPGTKLIIQRYGSTGFAPIIIIPDKWYSKDHYQTTCRARINQALVTLTNSVTPWLRHPEDRHHNNQWQSTQGGRQLEIVKGSKITQSAIAQGFCIEILNFNREQSTCKKWTKNFNAKNDKLVMIWSKLQRIYNTGCPI